ncbi:MAG: hypothetical protein L0G99_17275 [Propionibacteriales bacterium]|nr:hypothetical protein [Propionibacteriales bacterium]
MPIASTTHIPARLVSTAVGRPSVALSVIAGGILLAGVGLGLLVVDRWPIGPVPNNPVENRVLIHVIIGGAVTFAISHVTARRGSATWLGWPISRAAARRMGATLRGTFSDPLGPMRTLALLVLGVVLAAAVLRVGLQVGLSGDPGRIVNAWGGPSAVGAFAALTVDALCVMAAACGLAHLVLRADPAARRAQP